MSDLKEIKKRIYESDRIIEVLELLGCNHVRPEGDLIVAALPKGDNRRSVQVKNNESLTSNIRSKGVKGDIYAIVSYIQFNCASMDEIDDNLPEAKMWLIEELGYEDVLQKFKKNQKEKVEYNGWLKTLKKKRKSSHVYDDTPNEAIDESVKNDYVMIPYYEWIKEGISYDTQMEWEVGVDHVSRRVITLVRGMTGELIGVKGRATDDAEERKYLYIKKMNKSIELFGLHKTLPYILEQKEIILFEGYKSVMKSWQMGYKNCASIEGDDISPAQIKLIKSFGIDIKITVCYDKDKSEKEIQDQLSKITGRTVFYTYDVFNHLKGKDSPVDKGKKVFEELYKSRKEYRI